MYPPRAPVVTDKSGTWDVGTAYAREIDNFRQSAREEAARTFRLNQDAALVGKYLRCIYGEQWAANTRKWRSTFVDNRIAKARYDHLAQLTDTRPIIDVATSVPAFEKTAEVIAARLKYQWDHNDIDLKLVTVADITDCYGTGFWRLGAAKPGIMNVLPCGPDQVMPIQPGFDMQDSTAVLFRTWKPIWWIKQKFPFSSQNIEREIMTQPMYGSTGNFNDISFNRPSHIDEYTWNGLSQGMKRLLGIKGQPVQSAMVGQYFRTMEIEELFIDDPTVNESKNTVIVKDPFLAFDQHNWWYEVKPGQRLFPRKRHMVFAGSRLLSDGPSPYWHGLYPFATLRFNPIFSSFWGISKYRDLVPLNQAMNEIVGGALDLIKRALNPTSITKDNAMSPAAWNAFYPDLPGYKLRVNPQVALNDALKYMDPPDIPAYVFDMLRNWLAPEFDRMSGAIDIQGLSKKNQVPGGDTLDIMRDSQNTSLKLEGRMLETFIRDAGVQAVSNELQFATTAERLKTLGEAGLTPQDFNSSSGDMLPEDKAAQPDYWRQFALSVKAGSAHTGAKDRSRQIEIGLAARGQFPLQRLYKDLDINKPEEAWQQLLEEKKTMGMAAPDGNTGKDPSFS